MADTRVQSEVEDWVREHWLPTQYGQRFHRERVRLSSGGVFDFDGVGEDHKIVVSISTSQGYTASRKLGGGKLHKLRADVLFLLLTEAEHRVMCLTERDMFEICQKERTAGRIPQEIEFVHALLPKDLDARLRRARETASREVSPPPQGSKPPA